MATAKEYPIPFEGIQLEDRELSSQKKTLSSSNGDLIDANVKVSLEIPADGDNRTTDPVPNGSGFSERVPGDGSEIPTTADSQENNSFENRSKHDVSRNILLAATCIEDAILGRTLVYNTDDESLVHYRSYSERFLQLGTILSMWLLLFLALFEDPAVPGAELVYWATMIMEIACLAVIVFRLYQLSTFVPRRTLITDPKNIVIALTVVVTLIDMIVYIIMMSTGTKGIRISRCLRPLFLINMNESRQVRRAFRNIRMTVPEILNVLILFMSSIALFTLLAFKLFQYRELVYRDGEPYFTDYWDSFFDLYVLVTTANSPDVMMPAYDSSGWFSLFFIAYIVINTYIFMNLFLAVIYNSYRNHLKTEIRGAVLWKRNKLERAFELLKDLGENSEKPAVSYNTWCRVMNNLTSPPSNIKINLYWEVLSTSSGGNSVDDSRQGGIEKSQFLQVANLLNVYVVEDATAVNWFLKTAPEVYLSKPSRFIQYCVKHRIFVWCFDLLIIANAVCIGVGAEETEWFFLSVFILEILLKIYVYGPREYFSFHRLWNWFDFIIIMAAFIATIVEASLNELNSFPREVLDFIMVLRCLRLVRIAGNIQGFRTIIMTIVNILPSLLTYGVVLVMLYYAFAIVGMEAFKGKIRFINDGTTPSENYCGNPKLDESEFLRMGYCNNNFNDILHSLVTLVILTVVNQWHIITLGYTLVTTKAARLYFIMFHLIVVILIMNIIVAFVLEAFILEYSLSKTTIEDRLEKTIHDLGLHADENVTTTVTDRTGIIDGADPTEDVPYSGKRDPRGERSKIKFRIKEGHKNIEVILQKMFEGEIAEDGTVPSSSEGLTLDGVTGTSVSI